MQPCPECKALEAKLSRTERKRDVANRLARKTPAPEPDTVQDLTESAQVAGEEYALAIAEAEDHERLTGHEVFDGSDTGAPTPL